MICDNCKIDKLVRDFINNQKFCYKFEYQKKISKTPKKRTSTQKCCRMCKKKIIRLDGVKKRQRTVFCSLECAEKGHKEICNNYWTRKIRKEFSWHTEREEKWNLNQI